MSTTSRTNVILAGSTGIPGRNILTSLQSLSSSINLHITLLKRSASVDPHVYGYPREVLETAYIDYANVSALTSTLVTLAPNTIISALNAEPEPNLDNTLLTAAIAAGDKLGRPVFYVNGYTLDILHPSARKYAEHFKPKIDFANRLQVEAERGKVEYCTIVNAGFIDYVLMKGYAGIRLMDNEATLFDGGKNKLTGCSLAFVGDVVGEVVRLVSAGQGEEVRNRRLKVAEVEHDGKELVAVVERATGQDFNVSEVSTKQLAVQGRTISALNWSGEGAAWFAEEGMSFGKDTIERRTLKVIVEEAIKKGPDQFENIGR